MTSCTADDDDWLACQPPQTAFVDGQLAPPERPASGQRSRIACSLCGAVTRSDYMKLHMRTHENGSGRIEPERAAACFDEPATEPCGSAAPHGGRSRRERHQAAPSSASSFSAVVEQKRHVCTVCDRAFTSISTLKDHGLTHSGQRPHACDHCGRSFSLASTLRRHAMTHTGEKPHVCIQCGQAFSLVCNLRSHLLTHTGERRFPCDRCGMRLGSAKDLRRHGLTHTPQGDRPFVCQQCGRRFLRAVHLKSHELVHVDREPAVCDTCGLSFKSPRGLHLHERRHGSNGSAGGSGLLSESGSAAEK